VATPLEDDALAATVWRPLVQCTHETPWQDLMEVEVVAAARVWAMSTMEVVATAMALASPMARRITSRWNSIAWRCSARRVLENRRWSHNFAHLI